MRNPCKNIESGENEGYCRIVGAAAPRLGKTSEPCTKSREKQAKQVAVLTSLDDRILKRETSEREREGERKEKTTSSERLEAVIRMESKRLAC